MVVVVAVVVAVVVDVDVAVVGRCGTKRDWKRQPKRLEELLLLLDTTERECSQ